MILNRILPTTLTLTMLIASASLQAEFIEKDGSVYFKESNNIINDVKTSHEDHNSFISYALVDSTKDNKWAIITKERGGTGMRTSEVTFLYYYPKKVALDKSLYNDHHLYGVSTNINGEYLEIYENDTIYLSDLEAKIKSKKHIKLWGHDCSGDYLDFDECGLYFNTKTNNKEWYIKTNNDEYRLYEESSPKLSYSLKITPPIAYYTYSKEDGYIKNFWHYTSGEKYRQDADRIKKTTSLSHKDLELKEGAARPVLKEFTKTQSHFMPDSQLIGRYHVGPDFYRLYIYKQEAELRFFLFRAEGELEVMGGILTDPKGLIFTNQKANNKANEKIMLKSDSSLTSINIKFKDVYKKFPLNKM